jgi:energy-coupling factor transporter transmembrane protein EcfT
VTTLDLVAGCLIVGFVVILLIYFLLKLKKKEPFSPAEKQMPFFIMGALLIYVVLLAIRYSTGISNTDRLQILLQLGLVTITAVYAWSARQQSEANAKMAEEMQNQRYDLFRPVINIEVSQSSIAFENQKLFYVNTTKGAGDLPNKITCVLHNVGVGPAIDIYSYFRIGDKEGCEQRSIGTLSKDSKSDEKLLALQKQGATNGLLFVIYSDAYGRYFASRREIYVAATAEPGLKLEVSPLEAFKLPRKGKPKTYEDVQKAIQEELKDVEMPTI